MNKKITLILIIFIFVNFYGVNGQSTFTEGYFISKNDKLVTCLIYNNVSTQNPTSFKYKLTKENKIERASIDSIQEYGIKDRFKYVRCLIDIDTSSGDMYTLSYNSKPENKKMLVFLKVIVEGKASLLAYNINNNQLFFFSLNKFPIEPLIYKKYLINDNTIKTNNSYRQKLKNNLVCDNLNIEVFDKLKYEASDLSSIFIKYNDCNQEKSIIYLQKMISNFSIRPGLCISNLLISKGNVLGTGVTKYDIGSSTHARLGLEMEFIFPAYDYKWAVIFEPVYTAFSKSGRTENVDFDIKYKAIGIPFGIRYYFTNSKKTSAFINASLLYDVSIGSSIKFGTDNLKFSPVQHANLGFGIRYKRKLGFEAKYDLPTTLLANYDRWETKYKILSIIASYKIN